MALLGFGPLGAVYAGPAWQPSSRSRSCRMNLNITARRSEFFVQSFRQPQWLLPNGDGDWTSWCTLEGDTTNGSSRIRDAALYIVQLFTSNSEKSSFSEPNGSIWFALLGEDGRALLRRVLPLQEDNSQQLRFQRGDVDVIKFAGPDLGQIAALWIGPEAGTWRLEEARVTVISHDDRKENEAPNSQGSEQRGIVYVFEGNGSLLGDGGDLSGIELKASMVFDAAAKDSLARAPLSAEARMEMRREGMKEYESLERSLLISDATLVSLGTGLLAITGYRDAAIGFAVGGAGGFVYLFLLERAVDQLSVSPVQDSGFFSSIGKSIARLALVMGFIFIAGRAVQGSGSLSSQELLAGAAGFLTYKIAVFLAATNPTKKE